jgi:uncharacterized damage-inducible protein DinB
MTTTAVTTGLLELISYSDHERGKWRAWIEQEPSRLAIPFQPGGRFPTVASVFDHVFLVERRHLARLEGGTPPDSTGCAPDDWQALFDYADLVRADYRHYVEEMDPAEAAQKITFTLPSGTACTMTRRKLALHILLHEVRHLAQVALAARAVGVTPPGEHDLFFFDEFA